jgi:2-desacetyl-2-hydroxyethyl bacteriochlorophyllide A dehydrogenase
MKAVQINRFGAPDVLSLHEVDRPAPGGGEVLVQVEASSVNGHDVIIRAGGLKMVSGRKFPLGIGLDFVGVVVAAGPEAADYRAGGRVWGTVHPRQRHATGAAAEYVVVPVDRVAPAPAGLTPSDAASLVVTGTTALIALRDSTYLQSGERVLVRGAAGGVGTAAVQLAHAMGGHVTALARDRHARALADLGADRVLGYDASPEETGTFDVIVDTPGSDLECYRRRLAKNGRMVTVGLSASALAAIGMSAIHGSRRIRTFSANPDTALLEDLSEYVASGALRPVVSGVFPLTDIAAAQQAFSQGGTLGKHVVTVAA